MWQGLVINILVKAGTSFLLQVGEEVLKTLKERSDNAVDDSDVQRIKMVKNERLNREG